MAYVKFDKEFAAAVKQTLVDINEEISLAMSSVSSSFNNKKISLYSSYLKIYDEEGELIADYTGYANRYNTAADNGKDRAITIKNNVTSKVSKVIRALEKVIGLVETFESQTGLTLESELGEDLSSVFQFLATYGDASSLSALKGTGIFGNASLNGIYSFDESLLDFDNLSIWSSFGGFLDEQEGDGELENSIREFFLGKLNGYLDENGNVIIDGQDFGSLNSLSMATLLQTDAGQQMKAEFIDGYKDKLNTLMFGEGLSGTGMTPFEDSTEETNGLVTSSMLPGAMALMTSVLSNKVESSTKLTEEETKDRMDRLNTALENAVDNTEDPSVVQEMFKEILAQNEFEASDETIALLVEQYTTQKELLEKVDSAGGTNVSIGAEEEFVKTEENSGNLLDKIVSGAQELVGKDTLQSFETLFEERNTDSNFNDWLEDNEINLDELTEEELAEYRTSFEKDVRAEIVGEIKSNLDSAKQENDRVVDFDDSDDVDDVDDIDVDSEETFVDKMSDAIIDTATDALDKVTNDDSVAEDENILEEELDSAKDAAAGVLGGLVGANAALNRGEQHTKVEGFVDEDRDYSVNIDTNADGTPDLNIDSNNDGAPQSKPQEKTEQPKDNSTNKIDSSQAANNSSPANNNIVNQTTNNSTGMTKPEAPATGSTTQTGTSQSVTTKPSVSTKLPEVPVMQSSGNKPVQTPVHVDEVKNDAPKETESELKSSSVIAGAAGAAASTIIGGSSSGANSPVTLPTIQNQVPDVDYSAPAPVNPSVSNTPIQSGSVSNNTVFNNTPVNSAPVNNNNVVNNSPTGNAVGHTGSATNANANVQTNTSANSATVKPSTNSATVKPSVSTTQSTDASSETLGKGKSSYGAPADAPSGKTSKAQTSGAKANTDITHEQERNLEDLDGQVNTDAPEGFLGDSSYAQLLEKNEKEVKIATAIMATSLFATLTLKLTNVIGIVSFVLVLLAIILVYTTFRIKKGKERKKLESLIIIEKINKEKELSVKQTEENTANSIETEETEVVEEVVETEEVPYEVEEEAYEEVVVEEPVTEEVYEIQEEVVEEIPEENIIYEEEIVYVDEDGNVIDVPEGTEIVYEEVVVEEPVTEDEIPEKKEFQSAEEVIYGKKNKKKSKKDNA